jgi:hypothetical protein
MEKFDTQMIKAWVFLAIFWFLCDTSHGAEAPVFMGDQQTSAVMGDPVLLADEDQHGIRKEMEVAVDGISKSTVGNRDSAYSLAAGKFDLGIASRSAPVSQPISREIKLYDHQGENEKKYDVEKMPGFIVSMSLPF